jgi:uncharacterized membrane protein
MNLRAALTRDSLRRPPLRVQLTVLYAGLFIALVAVVLGVSGLLVRRSEQAAPGTAGPHTSTGSHSLFTVHQLIQHFNVGPAIAALIAVLIALWLAWWIAEGHLRHEPAPASRT